MASLSLTLRLSVKTGTFVHCIFIVNISATAKITSKFLQKTDCYCVCHFFSLYIQQHYNDNFQLKNVFVF